MIKTFRYFPDAIAFARLDALASRRPRLIVSIPEENHAFGVCVAQEGRGRMVYCSTTRLGVCVANRKMPLYMVKNMRMSFGVIK